MNKALLFIIVTVLVIATAGYALAAGYNEPQQYTTSANTPHGGYTTTTNKCKECHAVHLATGSYRLLRGDDPMSACEYCHGEGGAGTGTDVRLDAEGHGLGGATGSILVPHDTSSTATGANLAFSAAEWGCAKCHDPHGVGENVLDGNLIGMSSNKLLLRNPSAGASNGPKVQFESWNTTDAVSYNLSQWCSACHNADIGGHTEGKTTASGARYGHDVGTGGSAQSGTYGNPSTWSVDPDNPNTGPQCEACHTAGGGFGSFAFPHSSGSEPDMLAAGTVSNQLDAVCLSCHATASLP